MPSSSGPSRPAAIEASKACSLRIWRRCSPGLVVGRRVAHESPRVAIRPAPRQLGEAAGERVVPRACRERTRAPRGRRPPRPDHLELDPLASPAARAAGGFRRLLACPRPDAVGIEDDGGRGQEGDRAVRRSSADAASSGRTTNRRWVCWRALRRRIEQADRFEVIAEETRSAPSGVGGENTSTMPPRAPTADLEHRSTRS